MIIFVVCLFIVPDPTQLPFNHKPRQAKLGWTALSFRINSAFKMEARVLHRVVRPHCNIAVPLSLNAVVNGKDVNVMDKSA